MAGGVVKYRHLSRKSSHRQALLRNLVTSLFEHEAITTTYPKAKEAQRLAEKMVTLAKRNSEASRKRAHQIFYKPFQMVPKLFGPIRERYAERPGGYTRVLRIEPEKEDQAESAILELVDRPNDMRFLLTARTLARIQEKDHAPNEITQLNIKKVTQFRKNGEDELQEMVEKFSELSNHEEDVPEPTKEKVYPDREIYGKRRNVKLPSKKRRAEVLQKERQKELDR